MEQEKGKKLIYTLARGHFLRGSIKARLVDKLVKAEDGFLLLTLAHACRQPIPEAEPIILRRPDHSRQYAQLVLKRRWPEGEATIIKGPKSAAKYALHVLKNTWPEAERTIARNGEAAEIYAEDVLGEDAERWQFVTMRTWFAKEILHMSDKGAYRWAVRAYSDGWDDEEPETRHAYRKWRDEIKARFPIG